MPLWERSYSFLDIESEREEGDSEEGWKRSGNAGIILTIC